jgi:hypothetical protein
MNASLVLDLNALLEAAGQKLSDLEQHSNEAVSDDLSRTLLHLSNKHIPAELCGEIKLFERIDEVNNLLERIEMAKVQSNLTVNSETLLACAKAAILRWSGPEGTRAKALQQGCTIDTEFTRQWLSEWGLSISNPTRYRENLAVFLSDVARPAIIPEPEGSLPKLVEKLVIEMQAANAAKDRQTSLMSKFAFSLRPEALVPYDKRARAGIKSAIGARVIDHDYVDYMEKFNMHILPAAEKALDTHNIPDKLIEDWQPIMTKEIFVRRTADKLFMVLGGFDPKNL